MHYVSLLIEFLRGRPRFVFWSVTLAQAALWLLVPSLTYSSPPGDVSTSLAIGHELLLGSERGPPLAFWLAEGAFRIGGIVGVYALAQICIVLTYYAVFALGRAIVGTRHAVLAVLLMVGISAFTVPSPTFGPAVLAAPFWALSLLYFWRAVGERSYGAWFPLAVTLGLLLLSSEAGVILLALMILFTLAAPNGRRALKRAEPWMAGLLLAIVVMPYALWAARNQPAMLASVLGAVPPTGRAGVRVAGIVAATHLGMLLLLALVSGFPRNKKQRAPEIDRTMPAGRLAKTYVYTFALAPLLMAVGAAFAFERTGPFARVTPLLVLSGLAVMVLAGDRVRLFRERVVSTAWLGILLIPPALVAFSALLMPWVTRTELATAQPVRAEAAFFSDAFSKRTGKPLTYIAGDSQLAPMIALAAPARPHVYFDWAPEQSPWTTAEDLKRNGGVLVWPAPGTLRNPPPQLAAQFPGLVPEVPQTFERPVRGILPPVRIGWAVIRPAQ
jgi:4-amino-4-deoxy-L-arabinose transferase-like glycosyltransferase